jgi:hypothetical protein
MNRERKTSLDYALSSDVRREILRHLARQRPGEGLTALELAEILDLNLEVASYHLRRLDECGAVRPLRTTPPSGPLRISYAFDIHDPWALATLGIEERGTASDG